MLGRKVLNPYRIVAVGLFFPRGKPRLQFVGVVTMGKRLTIPSQPVQSRF